MTAYLNLSEFSRSELENLVLTVHSAYLRTLVSVRENAPVTWRVRREVEAIANEAAARAAFSRALIRIGVVRDLGRERVRNDRLWESLPEQRP